MPYDVKQPIVKTLDGSGGEIRRLADSNIQADMDRALATLPADHMIAWITNVNLQNANSALMFRKPGSDWSFVVAAHYDWGTGDKGVGATVKWSK